MRKLLYIAWKDVYVTFTNRSLLLIMIATPLVISTIIGVAFGDLGGDNPTFSNIPVAVVNQDEGANVQGGAVNYGEMFTNFLIPPPGAGQDGENESCVLVPAPQEQPSDSDSGQQQTSITNLVNATVVDNIDDAREGVDSGDYAAAVIISPGFSQSLTIPSGDTNEAVPIEVYANSGQVISASIIRSIVQGFTNQIVTGNIAVAASVETLVASQPLAGIRLQSDEDAQAVFSCAFGDSLGTLLIEQKSVTQSDEQLSDFAQLMVMFGTGQAVFFAMFTGQFGVISIIEERRQGTLQRLIMSPTPRVTILAGKLLGTLFNVIVQIVILMISLMLIASLLDGKLVPIWGHNVPGLAIVLLCVGLAVCGLGVLMSGVAKTPEQVGAYGSIINIILALGGGSFGISLPSPFREPSLIYWGVDAFKKLSAGNNDILLNLVVLLVQAAIFFMIGAWIFSRRVDI